MSFPVFSLIFGVHVDAREDAETLGAERLGRALDGMIHRIGYFPLKLMLVMACFSIWSCENEFRSSPV